MGTDIILALLFGGIGLYFSVSVGLSLVRQKNVFSSVAAVVFILIAAGTCIDNNTCFYIVLIVNVIFILLGIALGKKEQSNKQ